MNIEEKCSSRRVGARRLVVLAAGVLVLVVGQGVSAYSATEIKPAEGPMAGGQEVTIKGDFPRNRNGVRSVDVNASGNLSVLLNDGRVFLHDKFGTTQEMTLPAELAGKDVRGFVRGMDTLGTNSQCAAADGKLYCWGDNRDGLLDGGAGFAVPTPVEIGGALAGKTVTAFDMDWGVACAVADGSLYCWGKSGVGAFENGTYGEYSDPVLITGELAGKTVTDVSLAGMSNQSACVVADARAYCWGYGDYGYLSEPVAWDGGGRFAGMDLKQVAYAAPGGFGEVPCVVTVGGRGYCKVRYHNDLVFGVVGFDGQYIDIATSSVLAGKTIKAVDVNGPGGSGGWGTVVVTEDDEVYFSEESPGTPLELLQGLPTPVPANYTVKIGGADCVDVRVTGENQLTCTTTAHAAGLVDVVIGDGNGTVVLKDGYTYAADVPGVPDTASAVTGQNAGKGSMMAWLGALAGIGAVLAAALWRVVRGRR